MYVKHIYVIMLEFSLPNGWTELAGREPKGTLGVS